MDVATGLRTPFLDGRPLLAILCQIAQVFEAPCFFPAAWFPSVTLAMA